MKSAIAVLMAIWTMAHAPAWADKIYRWTDQDGIQRFSDAPPPDSVRQFDIIQAPSSPSDAPKQEGQRRPGFDRMVDNATSEADKLENERLRKQRRQEALEKRREENRRKAQIESKRRQLESRIAEIKKRAVSPTYPQGMKEAQIKEIQQQIDQLTP